MLRGEGRFGSDKSKVLAGFPERATEPFYPDGKRWISSSFQHLQIGFFDLAQNSVMDSHRIFASLVVVWLKYSSY
jgi:hypothetical protein